MCVRVRETLTCKSVNIILNKLAIVNLYWRTSRLTVFRNSSFQVNDAVTERLVEGVEILHAERERDR